MKASIVIPVYNSEKVIRRGIEACLNQAAVEIIVVDDGSSDNTANIVKRYPVKYIFQNNAGPARARNTGWINAKGDVILFTDSDCIPDQGWASKHLSYYEDPEVAGVGGSYNIANPESILARCIHEEIIQRHLRMPKEVNYLGSFNLSYRREILEKTRGFNENFKNPSGEDNELSYKVKKSGYKLIFDKDIKVSHYHQTRLFKYLKEQYQHGYWRMKLYKLHFGMIKGDNYAGILDFIQPPLAMLALVAMVASFFYRPLLIFSLYSVILLLVLQLPITLAVLERKKQFSYLFLLPFLSMRAFSRGLGMAWGIGKFFLLGKDS